MPPVAPAMARVTGSERDVQRGQFRRKDLINGNAVNDAQVRSDIEPMLELFRPD